MINKISSIPLTQKTAKPKVGFTQQQQKSWICELPTGRANMPMVVTPTRGQGFFKPDIYTFSDLVTGEPFYNIQIQGGRVKSFTPVDTPKTKRIDSGSTITELYKHGVISKNALADGSSKAMFSWHDN